MDKKDIFEKIEADRRGDNGKVVKADPPPREPPKEGECGVCGMKHPEDCRDDCN